MMNAIQKLAIGLAALGLASTFAHAAAPKGCSDAVSCVATRSFLATVTNFRTNTQGRTRVLTATVRFENRTDKPLTLGYVRDSGIALDYLGNRYAVPGANAVRAIGEISGATFDPKFTLQPGEASDARFELTWEAGKQPVPRLPRRLPRRLTRAGDPRVATTRERYGRSDAGFRDSHREVRGAAVRSHRAMRGVPLTR